MQRVSGEVFEYTRRAGRGAHGWRHEEWRTWMAQPPGAGSRARSPAGGPLQEMSALLS
jgi:hypothetical protein